MVFLTLSVLIFRKSGRWKNVCCFAGTYKFVGFIVLSKFVKIFGVYLVKIMICFLVHCRISLIILICFSQCLVHINIILCRALWCQGRITSLKWKFSFILHSLWLFCSIFIFLMLGISFIFLKFIYFSENISVLIKKLHLLSINCKVFLIW